MNLFLNIYSFCKKKFVVIKNVFAKTSYSLVIKVSETPNLWYSLN